METNWRTVQLFLEDYGVVELEVDREDNSTIRCNCIDFSRFSKCKHTNFAQTNMAENNGHFSIDIPIVVDENEAIAAMHESSLFRAFVLKYGKVKVI